MFHITLIEGLYSSYVLIVDYRGVFTAVYLGWSEGEYIFSSF